MYNELFIEFQMTLPKLCLPSCQGGGQCQAKMERRKSPLKPALGTFLNYDSEEKAQMINNNQNIFFHVSTNHENWIVNMKLFWCIIMLDDHQTYKYHQPSLSP